FLFPQVLRHCDGALDFFTCLREPAHLHQQVSPNAGKEMVAGWRRVTGEGGGCVECVESCGWALDHADGDCAIECHDWRWIDLQQGVVEKNDVVPVCLFGGAGAHVTCGNGCLQRVGFRATA